jgi:hypothetical protein
MEVPISTAPSLQFGRYSIQRLRLETRAPAVGDDLSNNNCSVTFEPFFSGHARAESILTFCQLPGVSLVPSEYLPGAQHGPLFVTSGLCP